MFFVKKVGFGALFCFVGYIIDGMVSGLIGYNGIGYHYLSLTVVSVVLFFMARTLRTAKLKKEHKGDDSPEQAIFNSDLKSKIKYVIKTADFKLEFILSFLVAPAMIFIPLLKLSFTYGLQSVFTDETPYMLILVWMIIIPCFIAVLNAIAWVMAYNGAYKRKEF